MKQRPDPYTFPPLTVQTRQRIEQAIEGLLALLDTIEPDPDLEPNLGWSDDGPVRREVTDDREGENEHGDNCDLEPSLGFVGIGTGHRSGETLDDSEDDVAEVDAPGFIGGGNEGASQSVSFHNHVATGPAYFTGEGNRIAADQVKRARRMPRKIDLYKDRQLPDGSMQRTYFVPRGYELKASDCDRLPWADRD